MSKITATEKQEAIDKLREWLKPGDTVYTVLRHVSPSGMSRCISAFVVLDGEPVSLDYWIARAIGLPIDRNRGGLKIGGVGSDMGFEIVYSTGYALFREGFGIRCQHCGLRPATKEQAEAAQTIACLGEKATGARHEFWGRNRDTSGWDNDGGYALKHRWL